MFTRDLYLHSGKTDKHFNPQFTHKTGFWDSKVGNFMQSKLQYDLHGFSAFVLCKMFVKQAWREICKSTEATIQLSLCSVDNAVELSTHILPEDIPGNSVVSLRPARQLKWGQTLFWKLTGGQLIFLAPYSSNIHLQLASEIEMYSIDMLKDQRLHWLNILQNYSLKLFKLQMYDSTSLTGETAWDIKNKQTWF